jgi:hypothetical protein
MTEATVKALLVYYAGMWLCNVAAYAVVSIGLYRWWRFVKGMGAEPIVAVTLKATALFALGRLTAGAIGLVLYELEMLSAIGTILSLGVTSLFQNTAFIATEGWFVNKEAKVVMAMPEPKQVNVRQAIATFDSLRRAANAK